MTSYDLRNIPISKIPGPLMNWVVFVSLVDNYVFFCIKMLLKSEKVLYVKTKNEQVYLIMKSTTVLEDKEINIENY